MSVKKLTREDVEQRLAEYMPGWTIRDSEWQPKNGDDKAPLRCSAGHDVDRMVRKIKDAQDCPHCNAEKLREEHARELIAALREAGYEPLFNAVDYVNAKSKLPTRCPNGNIYEVSKDLFINNRSRCNCPDCRKQKSCPRKYRSADEAISELAELGEVIIGEYKSSKKKVLSRCRKCGFTREIMPERYFHGAASCAVCAGRYKPTTEEYKREVEISRPGWSLAQGAEYINSHTPIPHICDKGHFARMCPRDFRRGVGCGECADLATAERQRGENNHNYNPNLTDEEREAKRNIPEFREWARKVKERDDFTCQACGKRGGRLESHHINAFKEYELLRYELANGITLCETCHKEIAHPDGFLGTENIFEFMDNILDKMNATDDAEHKRRLSLLYDEMLERLPILLYEVNKVNDEESLAG